MADNDTNAQHQPQEPPGWRKGFDEHNGKTKLTLQAVVVKSTPDVAAALAGME